jgi:hypothetical protein
MGDLSGKQKTDVKWHRSFDMICKKLIFSEIVLILGSVLIFRGLWTLLDRVPLMNNSWVLCVSLAMGIVITILALCYISGKGK